MSFPALLINSHLLLAIYALFIFWKDDVLSRGTTIDAITKYHQNIGTRKSIMLTMLTLCVLPILNLSTLYRLVLAELETTRDNWKFLRARVVQYKGGFIIRE